MSTPLFDQAGNTAPTAARDWTRKDSATDNYEGSQAGDTDKELVAQNWEVPGGLAKEH
jgi:hypothetical protein